MRIEFFPTYSIHIQLDEFHGIELVHGHYQIRFRIRQTFPFTSDLICSQKPGSSNNATSYVQSQTAISKPIKVAFAEQAVDLSDVFRYTITVPKRFDRIEPFVVEVQFELWYLDPDTKNAPENYTFVSKRVVSILLRPDRSAHSHRPIFFEYFSFCAVSITIHTSVTELTPNRTKQLPDPKLNNKLLHYHRFICNRLFNICLSLESFIKNYGNVLTSPLKIVCTNVENEVRALQAELVTAEKPWQLMQEHTAAICNRLNGIFSQLVQLFNCSQTLNAVLLEEFDQQRMKRFAEGFMFYEDTVHSLLRPTPNVGHRIFDLVKKCGYLNKLPRVSVRVLGTDVDCSNVTMISEHRYLPASSTIISAPSDPLIHKIPKIRAESDVSSLQRNSVSRRSSSSMERFQMVANMCLPLNCASKQDDCYEIVPKENGLLSPTQRFNKRRMTDPGANATQQNGDKTALIAESDSTLKSQSASDIIAQNGEYTPLSEPSTSASSSDSLMKSVKSTVESPTNADIQMQLLDRDKVVFVQEKEFFKRQLKVAGYRGFLYSDQAYFSNRKAYFSSAFNEAVDHRNIENVHLVVLVHGLEGTCEDLTAYRNYLRIALPDANFTFLLSEANQTETWSDLNKMAENLLKELRRFVDRMPRMPQRISMIAHSLGGLIVRTMCGLPGMQPYLPRLHTLLTLNSPHCGLLYNQRLPNWGIVILQWWKQSASLEQLTMHDAVNFHDTFLYNLSKNGSFGMFRNVLLVGSYSDMYVPSHSALVETCKAAMSDPTAQGAMYLDLLSHINESIVSSPRHTTVVKYLVSHSLTHISKAQQVTGRAVHIAVVDDDVFIEQLMTTSAAKYFQ